MKADDGHAGRDCSAYPADAVLDHKAVTRRSPKLSSRKEKDVRMWLSMNDVFGAEYTAPKLLRHAQNAQTKADPVKRTR